VTDYEKREKHKNRKICCATKHFIIIIKTEEWGECEDKNVYTKIGAVSNFVFLFVLEQADLCHIFDTRNYCYVIASSLISISFN